MIKHPFKKKSPPSSGEDVYEEARRAWNFTILGGFKAMRTWRLLAALEAGVILLLFGGWMKHYQAPKYIPYVIEVSDTGQYSFKGILRSDRVALSEASLIKHLRDYLSNLRLISTDIKVLTENLKTLYFFSSKEVQTQLTEYLRSEDSPLSLHQEGISREVSFNNFQKLSANSWLVSWSETYRKGGSITQVKRMNATLSYEQRAQSSAEEVAQNPYGVYFTFYALSEVSP